MSAPDDDEDIEDTPGSYRNAFMLQADAAKELAGECAKLDEHLDENNPRKRKHWHAGMIAAARESAVAWSDLAQQMEREQDEFASLEPPSELLSGTNTIL